MAFDLTKTKNIEGLRGVFDQITFERLKKLSPNDGILEYFTSEAVLKTGAFVSYLNDAGKKVTYVREGGVHETFYAAQSNGTTHQWYGGAGGIVFDTYNPFVAVNPDLQDDFPKASYVCVETENGSFCNYIMDTKGAPGTDTGWDSNKADYYNHLRDSNKDIYTRMIPADCKRIADPASDHPMAYCYPKRVYITFNVSERSYKDRNYKITDADIRNIMFEPWALEYFIEKYDLSRNVELPVVMPMRWDSSTDPYYRFVASMINFANEEDAKKFIEELCYPTTEVLKERDAKDQAYIDKHFCEPATIWVTDWPAKANSVVYARSWTDHAVNAFLALTDMPEVDEDLGVHHVDFQIDKKNFKEILKTLYPLGSVKKMAELPNGRASYRFTPNKKHVDDVEVEEVIYNLKDSFADFSFSGFCSDPNKC